MLAAAVANGSIIIYRCQEPSNLSNSFNEDREIQVISNGECTCLTWNPSFDEPMSIIVGCLATSMNNDKDTGKKDGPEQKAIGSNLLQLITFNPESKKELDLKIPFNGQQPQAPSKQIAGDAPDQQLYHTQMINDVQWAPMGGRSFHLVASCSKDMTVIIWRLVLLDIISGQLLDPPKIQAIQRLDGPSFDNTQVQRIKWNILGTCFATSGDNGQVKVWQRNSNSQFGSESTSLSSLVVEKQQSNRLDQRALVASEPAHQDADIDSFRHGVHHFKQLLHFRAKQLM